MRHTLQPTVLAASIVASLIGASAHAATQAELQQIQLYNGVTIAQDSVQSWGPWEQFEAPAAGNRLPMPTFASDASNLYRPIAPVVPPTEPPVVPPDQRLSGFGVFLEFNGEGVTRSVATIDATLSGATAPGTTSPATVSAAFQPIITPSIPFDSTGTLSYQSPGAYANAEGTVGASQLPALPVVDSDVIQAWPVLVTYLNGQSENVQAEASESGSLVMMYGAVGKPTSGTDMSFLRANNFSATYTGSTLASGLVFIMNAQFAPGTVSGSIGGPNYYKFNGTIAGAQVNAKFVGDGGSLAKSGTMVGTFTGAQAAGYIGAFNLTTKSNTVVSDVVMGQRGALQAPTAAPASVKP